MTAVMLSAVFANMGAGLGVMMTLYGPRPIAFAWLKSVMWATADGTRANAKANANARDADFTIGLSSGRALLRRAR